MRIVVNDIAASNGGAMTVLLDFYRFVCELILDYQSNAPTGMVGVV